MIHRDLKPENLFLVTKRGREVVKILDFGIARIAYREGGQEFTGHGEVYGSPTYMSPEQAKGDIDRIDHRSDLYAATVILVEALTGSPPFVGKSATDVMLAHLMKSPPPLSELAPHLNLPEYLDAIVAKGMAKHPEQRFSSARELRLSLRDAFPNLQLPPLGPMPQRRYTRELSAIQDAPLLAQQSSLHGGSPSLHGQRGSMHGGVGLAPQAQPPGTPHPSFYRGQNGYPHQPQHTGSHQARGYADSYPRSDQPPLQPVSSMQSDVWQVETSNIPQNQIRGREKTPVPSDIARPPEPSLRRTASTFDGPSPETEETKVLVIPDGLNDNSRQEALRQAVESPGHRGPDPNAQWDADATNALELQDSGLVPQPPQAPRDTKGELASTKALPEELQPDILKPMSMEELPSLEPDNAGATSDTQPALSQGSQKASNKKVLVLIMVGLACTLFGVVAALFLFDQDNTKKKKKNNGIQIVRKLPPLPQDGRTVTSPRRRVISLSQNPGIVPVVRRNPVARPLAPRPNPVGLRPLAVRKVPVAPLARNVAPRPLTVQKRPVPRIVVKRPVPVRKVIVRRPPRRRVRRYRRRVARRYRRRVKRRKTAARAGQIKLRIVTIPSKAVVLTLRKKFRCTTPCTLYFKKFKSVFLLVSKKGYSTRPLRWRAIRNGSKVVRLPKDPFSR